jgi:hypothetical protein
MKARGPVLTLLAVLAVGAAVFGVNTVVAGGGTEQAVTPAAQQAPAADPYAASDGYGAPAADPYGAVPEAAPEGAPEAAVPEAAPEQAPQAAAVTGAFAGRSAGNEVTLAVGMDGDKVVAYVCDGKKIESWFEGTSADGKLQLRGKDGELTADATDTAVLGTVAVGDKSWPFAAQLKKGAGAPTDRATLSELGSA